MESTNCKNLNPDRMSGSCVRACDGMVGGFESLCDGTPRIDRFRSGTTKGIKRSGGSPSVARRAARDRPDRKPSWPRAMTLSASGKSLGRMLRKFGSRQNHFVLPCPPTAAPSPRAARMPRYASGVWARTPHLENSRCAEASSLTFSPDGTFLAVGTGRMLKVWGTDSGVKCSQTIRVIRPRSSI